MELLKIKASEYANLSGVSLNTVKNRIRAGILSGSKEEDGIWYVYISQEEYDHLAGTKKQKEEIQTQLKETIDKLKSSLEGSLIATYIELQIAKDMQKEELLYELSSLYTLLAVKEKEIEFLRQEKEANATKISQMERELEKLKEEIKRLEQENKELEAKLKEKEFQIAQKDLEIQKALLEKEKELFQKEVEIEKLRASQS